MPGVKWFLHDSKDIIIIIITLITLMPGSWVTYNSITEAHTLSLHRHLMNVQYLPYSKSLWIKSACYMPKL